MKAAILVLGFLMASEAATPLRAQAPPGAPSVESIERLLVVTESEKAHTQIMEAAIATMMKNPLFAMSATVTRDFLNQHASYAVAKSDLIAIYRDSLTQAEVDGMIRFYESDIGRGLALKFSGIAAESMARSNARMQSKLPELISAIQSQLRDP